MKIPKRKKKKKPKLPKVKTQSKKKKKKKKSKSQKEKTLMKRKNYSALIYFTIGAIWLLIMLLQALKIW